MTGEDEESASSDHLEAFSIYHINMMNKLILNVYLFRLFAFTVIFMTVVSFLIFLNPPQKCIQVSVSVQQFHPYHLKKTRMVQALGASRVASSSPSQNFIVAAAKVSSNKEAFFRARLVHSDEDHNVDAPEDNEADDELDEDNVYENDDEEYDGVAKNKIFEDGDFDYNDTSVHSNFSLILQMYDSYANSKNSVMQSSKSSLSKNVNNLSFKKLNHQIRNITLINIEGVPIVEDRIFWSEELESEAPIGYNDAEAQSALQKLRTSHVKKVEPPTWNRCGRPKNQFVVFDDNSKACARYRAPHQYLVQGEILSFYLARLLGITNVPIVALSAVKEDFGDQWSSESVKKNLLASKWETNTTVALIEWIDNLERDKLPDLLLSSLVDKKALSPSNGQLLTLTVNKLVELLQWSDLIIFDYITGNYDRVASMQDAADKEKKPSIMQETIHNLVRSKTTGALWLIDNESGLLDSYSLLYGPAGQDGRFLTFHKQMLKSNCLFRRRTIDRIRWLHDTKNAASILLNLVEQLEPLFVPISNKEEVSKRLQERISEVKTHVDNCLFYASL